MLPTVSATKLKMFLLCQRQFYLKYIQNMTLHDWCGSIMGTAIHHAIAEHIKDPTTKPLVDYVSKYNGELAQRTPKDRFYNSHKMRVQGIEIVKEIQWELLSPLYVNNEPFIEYEFLLPYPNADAPIVMINGIIDLVTHDHKIIDHKSTKTYPDDVSNDLQFMIYHWAYEQIFKRKPNGVFWHHLRTNEMIEYVHSDYSKLDAVIGRYLKNYGKGIKSYKKKTKKDETCTKLCAFSKVCWK